MKRIQTTASWLSRATALAMIGIPVTVIAMLFQIAPKPENAAMLFPNLPRSEAISSTQLWLAIALGAPTILALLWTLEQMRRLFRSYHLGMVLTSQSARLILRIGLGLAIIAVLTIITGMAQSIVLSWAEPEGQRALTIAISDSEIGFFLAGGLLTLIGWAMQEAAMIADENRGFV